MASKGMPESIKLSPDLHHPMRGSRRVPPLLACVRRQRGIAGMKASRRTSSWTKK